MLQDFFDWLDDAASRILRIAYLIPFVIATALYFGASALPPWLYGLMGGVLPWMLAFAVETQTYVAVRKLARNYNGLQAPAIEDYQRTAMKKDMWVQGISVVFLSAFSVWNQASYLSETWVPSNSAFGAPRWLDIAIRALGPAVFFFLTSFAAPAAKTIGEKLQDESHKTLKAFLGVLTRQRKRAIKKIDADLTDMGAAIQTVAAAASERRVGSTLASVQGAIVALAKGESASSSPIALLPAPKQSSGSASVRRTTSMLDLSREHWRVGMTPQQLSAKTGTSVKTARRHIAQLSQAPFAVARREA